jgi:hypothetical protein
MDLPPAVAMVDFNCRHLCFLPILLFHRDHKALPAICPINVAAVAIGLLLVVFLAFDEHGTIRQEFGHVLDGRQIGCGK